MDTNGESGRVKRQKNTFDYILGIGMGLLVGIGGIGLLVITNVIKMPSTQQLYPKGTRTNTTNTINEANTSTPYLSNTQNEDISPQPTLDMTCPAQVKKYLQLSGNYYTVDGVQGGTMNGVLKRVDYTVTTKSATIEVESADGRDSYTFILSDDAVRLSNMATHQYYTSLAQLPVNQQIEISYECNITDNLFSIVGITVMGS